MFHLTPLVSSRQQGRRSHQFRDNALGRPHNEAEMTDFVA